MGITVNSEENRQDQEQQLKKTLAFLTETNQTFDDLDTYNMENFEKKKKKKKKPFNLDDVELTLSAGVTPPAVSNGPVHEFDKEEIDLDIDFSMAKKKPKSKKKDIDEFLSEKKKDSGDLKCVETENEENRPSWAGSDRDYTYEELLKRMFVIILDKNPEIASGRKPKFVMKPPQVLRVGTKKTSFANFIDIARTLHRMPKHLLDFLLAELGTSGSMDGNQQLIIKGRFQPKQIENVLRRYIKEYVTCHTCRSPETILQKDTRLFFLQCESCGSRCSVASIKSGFQAVTGKRAAIRAKTT